MTEQEVDRIMEERIRQINRCTDELAAIRSLVSEIHPMDMLLAQMDWLEALHDFVHEG